MSPEITPGPGFMTTIDLTDSPRPIPWRAPAGWAIAVVVYALVLHWQIGLPLSITIPQSAVYVLSFALISLPAQRWAKRSLGSGISSGRLAAWHVVAGVITVCVWFGLNALYHRWTLGPTFWVVIYANNWLFQWLFGATAYGSLMALVLGVEGRRRERERERREAALLVQAREAELTAIRSQFQPHFVLNALNSLLALVERDPAAARTMIVRLADVMKEVFDREDTPLVPLRREIDLIRAYLDVEQVRFGSRLTVSIDVAGDAGDVSVPAFLLQPIVENAVKHGLATHTGPGTIGIEAAIKGDDLLVTVTNSAGRLEPDSSGGRGLSLTRRRLRTMYGGRQSLTLEQTGAGVMATISVPADEP